MITAEQIQAEASEYTYAMQQQAFVDGAQWAIEQMRAENDRLRKALQIIAVEMDQITIPARNISQRAKKALE